MKSKIIAMKKSIIYVFLSILIVVILILVVLDFSSNRPGRMSGNPYKLEVDSITHIDPDLISFRETRNLDLDVENSGGMALKGDKLYVAADQDILVISTAGELLVKLEISDSPSCLDVSEDGNIIAGFRNQIALFSPEGNQIWKTDSLDTRSVITAVRISGEDVYVADAGQRRVHRYNLEGKHLNSFEGKTSIEGSAGFIVPSANFDLALTPDGELWVVNPGKHSLENYTSEGELRSYWENIQPTLEGFTGCCNPAHIAIMEDGSFVTSEKGVVRIKIHKRSGKFQTVVAPPDKFKEDGRAPDIALHEDGSIYALDFDRGMIRIFEPI